MSRLAAALPGPRWTAQAPSSVRAARLSRRCRSRSPRAAAQGAAEDRLAVVVATSKRGRPGAQHVALTGDALHASAAATQDRLGGPGTWLLTLPAEHVAGVQVVLRALLSGTPAVQDVRDGFQPGGLTRATARMRHGARAATPASSPTQLAGPRPRVGAATHPRRVRRRPGQRGRTRQGSARAEAHDVRVVTAYGMSEDVRWVLRVATASARQRHGHARARLGRVHYWRWPVVATGLHLGAAEATARRYTPDGFRTSDLGALAPDGTSPCSGGPTTSSTPAGRRSPRPPSRAGAAGAARGAQGLRGGSCPTTGETGSPRRHQQRAGPGTTSSAPPSGCLRARRRAPRCCTGPPRSPSGASGSPTGPPSRACWSATAEGAAVTVEIGDCAEP
ncbi:hypothetical protein HBB16_06165 [Pseudonocardia sp. MCCB 268]|nr:hypothetical protein [Pseudonocardia cytotoxica]